MLLRKFRSSVQYKKALISSQQSSKHHFCLPSSTECIVSIDSDTLSYFHFLDNEHPNYTKKRAAFVESSLNLHVYIAKTAAIAPLQFQVAYGKTC